MDLEMWRRLLLVLFLVGNGTLASEVVNKDIFEKLCKITGMVKGLMEEHENSGAKSTLEEALYGETVRAPYANGGELSGIYSGCALGYHGRSHYCSHIQRGGGSGASNNHGCFAHSLVGTFLCLCTTGLDRTNLCGMGIEGDGSGWSGWTGPSQDLLEKVWGAINKKCTENNTIVDLENLKAAVEEIKKTAQEKKLNNGYYLGGTTGTNGSCGGMNHGDACVTYPEKDNGPKIPWADKILEGINKTKTQSQTGSKDSSQTGHHEDHADHSDSDQDGEEEEEVEESTEHTGSHNTSNQPRQKKKRGKKSTMKNYTKQRKEAIKALLTDEGTPLTTPLLWLLGAFVSWP